MMISIKCSAVACAALLLFSPAVLADAASHAASVAPGYQSIAERFVQKAEALFSEGKFTSPESENAYTLFRAAQIIEPKHQAAKAGLNAVLIAEISAARDLMASAKYRGARQHLAKLKSLYPNNDLLRTLERDLSQATKPKPKKPTIAKSKKIDEKTILIDEDALKAKSSSLVERLGKIAQDISQSGEGVLIYARSDAQARWIYQQMRTAVPGYRIRGDLRIGEPSIKLLQPFN